MAKTLADVLLFFWRCFLVYVESFYRLFVSPSPKSIKGQLALVTGGGRGLGREIAYKLADHGAKLILWDINKEGCEETAKEINSRGGFAKAYVCNVTDYADVKKVAAQVREDVGDVEILVNNAGVMYCDDIFHLKESTIRRTMDVNVIAHFWTFKEFLPKMFEKNDGHIITIASIAGKLGNALISDYCASKYAAVGLIESIRQEIIRNKKDGIYTTTVCPLFINTNLINDQDSKITFNPGKKGPMQPNFVASEIVNGVLRNETEIYLPRALGKFMWITRFCPRKVVDMLREVDGVGFYYKE